jgi:hypothetical protein
MRAQIAMLFYLHLLLNLNAGKTNVIEYMTQQKIVLNLRYYTSNYRSKTNEWQN